MKVYVLEDKETGKVVGISEEKEAVKLFMEQYHMNKDDYIITKVKGKTAEKLFNKYAEKKGITFVSQRDIVAQGEHADAIFEAMSSIRAEISMASNVISRLMELNVSPEERLALNKTKILLRDFQVNDNRLEDVMRDTLLFYLSEDSNSFINAMNELRFKYDKTRF